MKLAIYTKGEHYFLKSDLDNILSLAERYPLKLSFNREFAEYAEENYSTKLKFYSGESNIDADFVVSIGGDGTFLHCVAMLGLNKIPILGVNSGRLGFLSSVGLKDIELAIKLLISGQYVVENRSMMLVTGDFGKEKVFPYIFNEFVLQKSELNMIEISLEIDNRHVATVLADGMIVSTPSGSTAYSLSSGGAILSPSCKALIITPIAPHNLTLRPVVVDEGVDITMSVNSRIGECYATLDNRAYKVKSESKFHIKNSRHKVQLVKLKGDHFFDTLRKKLMWGSSNSTNNANNGLKF